VLYQAAINACESGARSTALSYFSHCLTLLQDDPWNESTLDVNYQETLSLFTRAAETCWYQGEEEGSLALLQIIFRNAHDAVDKAPAWIIRSRIFAIKGNSSAAFKALTHCLDDLGLSVPDMSWADCDKEFHRLRILLQSTNKNELLTRPVTSDRTLATMGSVLIEMASAAFWSNSLTFYVLSLTMVHLHLNKGNYSQASVGYVHYASIAVARFGLTAFGLQLGKH